MHIRQQCATLGEVDDQITPRLRQLAALLERLGVPVALSRSMGGLSIIMRTGDYPEAHAVIAL